MKKKVMSIPKQIILMKKMITLIVIARISKVLSIILLILMLVTKMILKILIVKTSEFYIDSDITNKADIHKVMNETCVKYIRKVRKSQVKKVKRSQLLQ